MAANGVNLPPSTPAYPGNGVANGAQAGHGAANGVNGHNAHKGAAAPIDAYDQPSTASPQRASRMKSLLLALLLAISVALAAAPAAGYKSGWAYYRRSGFIVPPQYRVPVPITLKIWVGWIKGTNSVTNLLHAAAPGRFREYTYLRDVRESGQVIGGLAISFLLVSALVGFFYLLLCLFNAVRGPGKASASSPPRARSAPPALGPVGLVFGLLNIAWSCACYIVIAVGTAIYTRRTLGATYVCWPDWCFWLGLFSGGFWLITAGLAWSESRRTKRSAKAAAPAGAMTHNMAYDSQNNQPQGMHYDEKARAVV